jgi:uncharacterized protein YuzE
MTLPRITLDPETEYAYIYLTEPYVGIAKKTVVLQPSTDEPEAMKSLALDFDTDGRLVGIEVFGPASHALRSDVLDAATQPTRRAVDS